MDFLVVSGIKEGEQSVFEWHEGLLFGRICGKSEACGRAW
jgi:hypothetical protein